MINSFDLLDFNHDVIAQYPVEVRSGIKPDPTPLSVVTKCRAAFDMPPVRGGLI